MDKGLVEYQMKVHVFGKTTSPSIATYALRKTVENCDKDVKNFLMKNFYVDDGLLTNSNSAGGSQFNQKNTKRLKRERKFKT